MKKTEKGKRPNDAQKSYLIDHLELNVDFSHDRFTSVDGARTRENSWNSLADELNGLGGANKDGTKWRKFWMDQKLYVKARHAQLTAIANKSVVNVTKALKPLTEMEQRILAIMTPQVVDGDIQVPDFGAIERVPRREGSTQATIPNSSIPYN